jgi:N-acetylglutamate synthase-like GNAT family acetyltransferase
MDYAIEYLADRPEFLPVLAGWHHGEWGRLHPGDTVEKRAERMKTHLGKEQVPTTFVALAGGQPVGSASLVDYDMEGREDLTPWLASVYIAPEYRRRGVGSALVERVVEEARILGIETLYLFTWDQEQLYARLGWSVLERTEYKGERIVIMSIRP